MAWQKGEYEKLLWERAGQLSKAKAEIAAKRDPLYEAIQAMKRNANLHTQEIIREKENLYWQLQKELVAIQDEENRVQSALEKAEEGEIDEILFNNLKAAPSSDNQAHISKRKQKILEEAERLRKLSKERSGDEDDSGWSAAIYAGGALPLTSNQHGRADGRLRTGRHRRKVKNIDPLNAQIEFYFQTTDTHGGKVDHGKKGTSYTSKSGKKIRKK